MDSYPSLTDVSYIDISLYSTTVMLKPKINIRREGFSSVIFNMADGVNFIDFNTFRNIASSFFKTLKSDKKYFLLLRVKYASDNIVTLHKGILITKKSKIKYIDYIKNILSIKSNDYSELAISEIIFDYFIIDKNREKYYSTKWSEIREDAVVKLGKFTNSTITHFIPLNQSYMSWGNIILNLDHLIIISVTDFIYKIYVQDKSLKHYKIEVIKGKDLLLTFYDKIFKDGIFTRTLDNNTYYINSKSSKILLTTSSIKTKYLKKIKANKKSVNKIITFDIETINKNGTLVPILFSMFDGVKTYSFFGEDPKPLFNSPKGLSRKYRGYSVYAHNLSRFDIIFIFKYIASLRKDFDIKPILKDGNIISLQIKNNKKGISITFKDSYLLLRDSLLNLGKTFNCDTLKTLMPILNLPDNYFNQGDIDYQGKEVLKIDDFNLWKSTLIDYCENDCKVLHQVLIKFKELVFSNWGINIEKYPTTPSLAFAIFRKDYMPENTIPITSGNIFNFIKKSFTGGSTDMYIPPPSGGGVKILDVTMLTLYIHLS